MEHYNNIIIGFGKGGKTLAKKLAAQGETVLMIEKSDGMYGGTCINVGCLPSKNLRVSSTAHVPFADAIAKKRTLIGKLRDKNYHMLADDPNITVVNGTGRFVNNNTVEITTPVGTTQTATGTRLFINTGATPTILPIPGLADNPHVVDSTGIMELDALPNRLVMIGAGYIGLEFASMFCDFGSTVTVLDTLDRLMPREDDELAQLVKTDLTSDGVRFELSAKISKVDNQGTHSTVHYEKDGETHSVDADIILVATGRKPNTADLGLENTDIEVTNRGAIVVNDKLETTAPNVWAIGDVTGGLQFTYVSLDDFRIITNNLFGDKTRTTTDRNVVPYTVFLSTSFSHVGLTEAAAKSKGYATKTFSAPTATSPKANVMGKTRGMVKIVVDEKTNLFLGATIYAEESHEVINLIALAMKANLPYTMLRDMLYTHPTMSEMLNDLLK